MLPLHSCVRFALLGWVVLATLSSAFAVALNATKEEVVAELGRPTSQAVRGEQEILTYPKGVRIELHQGRVQSASGILLSVEESTGDLEPATPEPAHAAPESAADTASTGEAPLPAPSAPTTSAESAAPPAPGFAGVTPPQPSVDAPAQEPSEDASAEEEADDSFSDQVSELPFVGLLILLGIHLVITLVGLKIAFKVWSMDALVTGLLAIAGIDLLLHGTFVALGDVSGGFTTMPAVENGIPGVVMIFTIRHFCFNKDLSDAVQTAGVVKLSVALIKMFGAMTLLNSVF